MPRSSRAPRTNTARRTDRWLLFGLALGIAHHVDHVLRFDHSGWPFRPEPNTFTASLLVYPLLALALLSHGRPRLRILATGLLFAFPTLAHVLIETPIDQFATWTTRPDINLPGVTSPLAGGVAVTITIALSLCTGAAFVSALGERKASAPTSRPGGSRYRAVMRACHIGFGALLGTYLYSPWDQVPAFERFIEFIAFPAMVFAGIGLWQQRRIVSALERVVPRGQ